MMRPDVPLEKEEQAEALFNRVMELPFRRKQDLGKRHDVVSPRQAPIPFLAPRQSGRHRSRELCNEIKLRAAALVALTSWAAQEVKLTD
jgi:hypothetical protein